MGSSVICKQQWRNCVRWFMSVYLAPHRISQDNQASRTWGATESWHATKPSKSFITVSNIWTGTMHDIHTFSYHRSLYGKKQQHIFSLYLRNFRYTSAWIWSIIFNTEMMYYSKFHVLFHLLFIHRNLMLQHIGTCTSTN